MQLPNENIGLNEVYDKRPAETSGLALSFCPSDECPEEASGPLHEIQKDTLWQGVGLINFVIFLDWFL